MQVVKKQVAELWQTIQLWLHPPLPIVEDDWPAMASRLPRCTFLQRLADQVANDALNERPWNVSIAQLCEAISQSNATDLQHRAERFIERHYYICPSSDPHFFRTLLIFRHLVQKRLKKELN